MTFSAAINESKRLLNNPQIPASEATASLAKILLELTQAMEQESKDIKNLLGQMQNQR